VIYANVLGGKNQTIDGRIVPYALFTDAQLGRVGMTEKEARKKGHRLKIGKTPMGWVARAIERDETAGLMKIVVDAANDRILGESILASEGEELVQTLGAVMLADQSYTVLRGAIYIHPTLTEGFFYLSDSVQLVEESAASGATASG
jgi:pyruvate/2-oxoglutarate dehydrogenase complex dihydrolipoamide dehydrogenase (E3) component